MLRAYARFDADALLSSDAIHQTASSTSSPLTGQRLCTSSFIWSSICQAEVCAEMEDIKARKLSRRRLRPRASTRPGTHREFCLDQKNLRSFNLMYHTRGTDGSAGETWEASDPPRTLVPQWAERFVWTSGLHTGGFARMKELNSCQRPPSAVRVGKECRWIAKSEGQILCNRNAARA